MPSPTSTSIATTTAVTKRALAAGRGSSLGFRASSLHGPISVPVHQRRARHARARKPCSHRSERERACARLRLPSAAEERGVLARRLALRARAVTLQRAGQSAFSASKGASEQLMGATQRAWFLDTMKASTRTFKVWGSEVCLMPRHIDLTPVTLAPATLRQKICLSAEDWDGFPNERAALLSELAKLDNVVIVSGDLHCFFAGTPYAGEDPTQRVVEFVTGSLTSTTWLDGLSALAESDPSLPPETKFIAASVPTLLVDPRHAPEPAPGLAKLGGQRLRRLRSQRRALDCKIAQPALVRGRHRARAAGCRIDESIHRAKLRGERGFTRSFAQQRRPSRTLGHSRHGLGRCRLRGIFAGPRTSHRHAARSHL